MILSISSSLVVVFLIFPLPTLCWSTSMAGDDTPPPPQLDASSPIFLGPRDQPNDFITPARL